MQILDLQVPWGPLHSPSLDVTEELMWTEHVSSSGCPPLIREFLSWSHQNRISQIALLPVRPLVGEVKESCFVSAKGKVGAYPRSSYKFWFGLWKRELVKTHHWHPLAAHRKRTF